MEQLEGILKIVDKELKTINENGEFRSQEEIDATYNLIDVAKDIYCIWEYENSGMDDEEMSYANGSYARGQGNGGGRSYRGGSYDGGNSYDGGASYEGGSSYRGRGRNARRDSMGRYSREGGYSRNGNYRREYSRAGDKEEFIEQMREMMQDAPDENSRQSIQRMIQKLEQE